MKKSAIQLTGKNEKFLDLNKIREKELREIIETAKLMKARRVDLLKGEADPENFLSGYIVGPILKSPRLELVYHLMLGLDKWVVRQFFCPRRICSYLKERVCQTRVESFRNI